MAKTLLNKKQKEYVLNNLTDLLVFLIEEYKKTEQEILGMDFFIIGDWETKFKCGYFEDDEYFCCGLYIEQLKYREHITEYFYYDILKEGEE